MKHSELVGLVAERRSLTKADAQAVVATVFELVMEAASRDEDTVVNGFGKFRLKTNGARQGRNPATGEVVHIPASRRLGLQPAKALKDRLNA